MDFEKHRVLSLIIYILSIAFYVSGIVLIYKLLFRLHYYYLFITIPILFLLVTLSLVNLIKIILAIISLIFGRNDNSEVYSTLKRSFSFINRLCKYILIGIFAALLTSIMILDIIICIHKGLYILVSVSIVIWILLYYILFKLIVNMIKKEIRI